MDRLHILDLIGGTVCDAADRDIYLLYDSHELGTLVTDKIRKQEMHVSFHIGSLLNSME